MIECLTFCFESGCITVEIKVIILEFVDGLEVFPWIPDRPIPFLLANGLNTWLDPLFIDYMKNESHWWKVCLGVPYATSLWQAGDSIENNGKFKTDWYHHKDELFMWKYERWVE